MLRLVWCLLILALMGVIVGLAAPPAAAAEYPNVGSLEPWSAQTNYMSLAGYLRWLTFQDQGVWLSMAEAKRIVAEQIEQR